IADRTKEAAELATRALHQAPDPGLVSAFVVISRKMESARGELSSLLGAVGYEISLAQPGKRERVARRDPDGPRLLYCFFQKRQRRIRSTAQRVRVPETGGDHMEPERNIAALADPDAPLKHCHRAVEFSIS